MTLREMLMRKINGVPTEAHTDLSSLTGGEVLKWSGTNMAWEDQDSTGFVPFHFHNASNSGFGVAGYTGSASNVIDKFSFTSNTTASDHGDLTTSYFGYAGNSSSTDGFVAGLSGTNTIEKFSFTSNVTASDHGDLSQSRASLAGHSSTSDGYNSGGYTSGDSNVIDKFAWSSNTTASDHGDLSVARTAVAGQSSSTHGYTSGGQDPLTNTIEKFAFSSNTTASDHGDLSQARRYSSGQSSTDYGFTSGGYTTNDNVSNIQTTIDKFAWSSNTTATDHGDLNTATMYSGGSSSSDYSFVLGGAVSGVSWTDRIDKFAHSSNVTATDHGDLSASRAYVAGCQY